MHFLGRGGYATSFTRFESIANPWFGNDVLERIVAFKFLPQLADEHTQIFGLLNAVWPHTADRSIRCVSTLSACRAK